MLRAIWLIVRKDLTVEVRSRELAYTTLFFAISCVLVFAFSLVQEGRAAEGVGAGVLWMTIMFAGNVTGVTQTLPLAVYAEFQSSLDASIAAAAILVVAALAVLVGVHLVRADREQPL